MQQNNINYRHVVSRASSPMSPSADNAIDSFVLLSEQLPALAELVLTAHTPCLGGGSPERGFIDSL